MSNNPQWKMFQPPESHSSTLHDILDLQTSNMQAKQAYRNGECKYHLYPKLFISLGSNFNFTLVI